MTGRPARAALWAGAAGPIGFLLVSSVLAVVRHDVIERQGWVSWPSSMALGGAPGVPMIATFLWLGGVLRGVRAGCPQAGGRLDRWRSAGYLVTATGDVLLAFPTDAPGEPTSWHGASTWPE